MTNTAIKMISAILLTVAFAAMSASAQNAARYTATIPFDFNIGKVSFAAGEYKISRLDRAHDAGSILIQTMDGKIGKLVMASPEFARGAVTNKLIFNRYGDRYFLSEIATPTLSAAFRQTAGEREIAKRSGSQSEAISVRGTR